MAELYSCDLCDATVKGAERFQVAMEIVLPGGMRVAQNTGGLPTPGNFRRSLDLCEECALKFAPVRDVFPLLGTELGHVAEPDLQQRIATLERQLGLTDDEEEVASGDA